jgi:hypothetical protein
VKEQKPGATTAVVQAVATDKVPLPACANGGHRLGRFMTGPTCGAVRSRIDAKSRSAGRSACRTTLTLPTPRTTYPNGALSVTSIRVT